MVCATKVSTPVCHFQQLAAAYSRASHRHRISSNGGSPHHNKSGASGNVRRKVIVIPFARFENNTIKVMLVQDRRSGDYAFLSGGVKARESVMHAASRELHEETYGALHGGDLWTSACVKHIEFFNSFRPQHRDEDILVRKKLGQHYPNGVIESCHVVAFEVPPCRVEEAMQAYKEGYKRIASRKDMLRHIETTCVIFEDIRAVSKWERDQMRGRLCSPDANGIHLWDVHVKNGLAMRVQTALQAFSKVSCSQARV